VAGRARARPDPTPADLAAFRAVSPIALVGRVTAPMLFLLGAGDRRVPPADAQRYVAALRARPDAPPCRVLLFPEDGHPLDKPQTEFESYMNIAAWLRAHL
jgi:acylaminoacyl-peptidase